MGYHGNTGDAADAARSLQRVLKQRLLRAKNQDSVLQALRLCERFLNHSHGTAAEFKVLKNAVKQTLSQAEVVHKREPQGQNGQQQTKGGSGPPGTPGSIHSSAAGSIAKMRCTALEARAHVRGGEYDRLEQVQEECDKRQIQQELQKKQQLQAATVAALNSQLEEHAQQQQLLREQKAEAQAQLKREIAQHRADLLEERRAQLARQAQQHSMYSQQVKEVETRRRQEAARLQAEAALEAEELAAQARLEQYEKERKAEADRLQMTRTMQDNRERLAARQLALERDKMESDRLNVEAQRRADAAERRREEEQNEREAKRMQAFRAAGGEALTKSLAEQARLDEERADRLQAEHEAEQAAKARQRAENREQQRLRMVTILDQQMADKKLQQQRDKAADMAAAKELSEQLLAEKERLKLEKIQRSNAMRATAHQQRKAINAETRQRFWSCQGAMDTAERKYHGEVLQGTHCGFRHLCNGSVLERGKISQRC